MYCPRCKQSFEEGSRRFCPGDGWRLVAEAGGSVSSEGGAFTDLIPKMSTTGDLDRTTNTGDQSPSKPSAFMNGAMDDIFFEFDDDAGSGNSTQSVGSSNAAAAERPFARKVDPSQIPKGHVDLADRDRLPRHLKLGAPESFVGRVVKGRYKVIQFLGGDESGLAYVAEDQIVGDRKVLVRIISGEDSDEILESILAEERVSLSHFSHPNIARLIDSGELAGGIDFLISEYIDSLSVAEILKIHGHIGPARVARIIRQAANALTQSHQEGILHRDVRPGNIIVEPNEDGTELTKLVNFGASNGGPNTRNFIYKSHEVLDGRMATSASDIHSLAVVAFLMLTGTLPFRGASAREIARAQNGSLLKPSDVRPELPASIDEVFARAFSRDPADHFSKARDLGDALASALSDTSQAVEPTRQYAPVPAAPATVASKPLRAVAEIPTAIALARGPARPITAADPAWLNSSPDPSVDENSRKWMYAIGGILLTAAIVTVIWYYMANNPQQSVPPSTDDKTGSEVSPVQQSVAMPPMARNLPQPPNISFFQNSRENLKGDLLLNFVGFMMYYPKDWKVNGPRESPGNNIRGKFIEVSGNTPDGKLKEQMLVSYYPSKGTFAQDADKFPQLVKETNETLKNILPGYEMVSQGETMINGGWSAYEIKFQGGSTAAKGGKHYVWGRRLFIPAARSGARNGFEITMLATSHAEGVHSVDDVGVKGELASILYSFEPSQNF